MHLLCRGSGDPILFIHGMPTSNLLWRSVIDKMCGRHTCFAIDLPGMGQTPHESYGRDYLERLAKRIDALRTEHGIARWHVVGHDAGSAVAVNYVESYQQHVGRMALFAPALFPDLKPYCLLECLRKRVMGELLAPLINPVFWNIAMKRATRNEEEPGQPLLNFCQPFSGVDGSWKFMRVLRWGKPAEVLAHMPGILPNINVPTLIVHGLHDRAIPQSFARRAQELIPNSELVHVDCGHFIPLNRPSFTADRLLQFFSDPISREASYERTRAVA